MFAMIATSREDVVETMQSGTNPSSGRDQQYSRLREKAPSVEKDTLLPSAADRALHCGDV